MKDIVPTLRELRHEKSVSAILISGLAAGCLLLFILIFTPVPAAVIENCDVISGEVTAVHSPCCLDVVIELAGDEHHYHINRGLERGIDLDDFRQRLPGANATIHYIRTYWTPLDPAGKLRPVAQVAVGKEVLYSDFQEE
jgi:hypothetical protein